MPVSKTITFVKLTRFLAPVLVLLYGVLSLTTVYGLPAADLPGKLISGFLIIWNAVNKGLVVMGAAEVLFCIMALRVSQKDRSSVFGEMMSGEPIGFLWKRLDLWLKLNAAILLLTGLFGVVSTVYYTLGNLPALQNATLLLYSRVVLSGLRGLIAQIVWASVFLGFGDIVFRLRRAVYRQTQPAE